MGEDILVKQLFRELKFVSISGILAEQAIWLPSECVVKHYSLSKQIWWLSECVVRPYSLSEKILWLSEDIIILTKFAYNFYDGFNMCD